MANNHKAGNKYMLTSFSPISDKNSKLLILGSMPGVESLKKQQYYANKRNQFWKILFFLFNEEFVYSYDRRIDFLLRNQIAVWDVLRHCKRDGSLDSNIKEEIVNDFELFFSEHPNITSLFFNGGKAYQIFKSKVTIDITRFQLIQLPSTSPANTMKINNKLDAWIQIKDFFS